MTRKQMLAKLHAIRQPIFTWVTYHDMGCDYCILSNKKVVNSMTASNWPVVGPLSLTPKQCATLKTLVAGLSGNEDEDEFKRRCRESGLGKRLQAKLMDFVERAGIRGAMAAIQAEAPLPKRFFLFDLLRYDSAVVLRTLTEVYEFFHELASDEVGQSWDSMTDDELGDWCSELEDWRKKKHTSPIPFLERRYW